MFSRYAEKGVVRLAALSETSVLIFITFLMEKKSESKLRLSFCHINVLTTIVILSKVSNKGLAHHLSRRSRRVFFYAFAALCNLSFPFLIFDLIVSREKF